MIRPQNILIVRTDRIGDLVLTLPLAGIIKKNLPGSLVSFLVQNYTSPIVNNHTGIDNVLILKEKQGKISFWENVREIKKYNFDSCIVVYPTFKIALMMLAAGIKLRVGTGYRWYSFLFNKKIYQHRKNAEFHELEYNVNLLTRIGINEKVSTGAVGFGLAANKESEQKIKQLLYENGIRGDNPIVVVHPGSGGSAVDLPLTKLKQLIGLMACELKIDIIITGSKSEKELCEQLMVNPNIKNFAGLFDLGELIALISRSEIIIGNSTGPIHIGAALGKFVIGFYPKITACSPERWGPYTNKKAVFQPKLECNNCTREQCEELDCMSSIEMKEVFDKIKNILHDNVLEN